MAALLDGMEVSLTGVDYNPESIAWCRQNLPGIRFVENGLAPPLGFPDSTFDVVYNFSVLTHLSEELQLAWMSELKRVLRPGGLLVFTTHGDAYRHLLVSQDEKRAYDEGRAVVQGGYQEGRKWFLAIHPEAFVRGRLLDGWSDSERIPVRPAEGVLQDVWAARKPHPAASG
jgi:SAM-dependent methyltransferase